MLPQISHGAIAHAPWIKELSEDVPLPWSGLGSTHQHQLIILCNDRYPPVLLCSSATQLSLPHPGPIMGVKDLWTILAPVKREKSLGDLSQGKKLAVDLSGWVCQADTTKVLIKLMMSPMIHVTSEWMLSSMYWALSAHFSVHVRPGLDFEISEGLYINAVMPRLIW